MASFCLLDLRLGPTGMQQRHAQPHPGIGSWKDRFLMTFLVFVNGVRICFYTFILFDGISSHGTYVTGPVVETRHVAKLVLVLPSMP